MPVMSSDKKKNVFLQWVSLIRPAPVESPRTGR